MGEENVFEMEINHIFDSVQTTSACHPKNCALLKKTLEKNNLKNTLPVLTKFLEQILLMNHKGKNPYVEKLINFVALFCTTLKSESIEEDPILLHIYDLLLQCQCLHKESVRYWSCNLLARIFDSIKDISDEMCNKVKKAMMERLQDSLAVIRYQAVLCAYHLQEPKDKNDKITNLLLERANLDPNYKVRLLSIKKLVVRKETFSCLLERIRDVNANVRLAAFEKINKFMPYLTIAQRQDVVTCGFLDSSDKIREFMSDVFLITWLDSYENDYLKMIKCLRLDASERDIENTIILVEFTLKALFSTKSLNELVKALDFNDKKVIEFDSLNFESAVYWRILVQHLRKDNEYEQALDEVLPELVNFCGYIKSYHAYVQNNPSKISPLHRQVVFKQLFLITEGCDVGDYCSRTYLNDSIRFVFENTDLAPDVAGVVMSNLTKTITNVESRCTFVCEIISNIMYGSLSQEEEEANQEASYLERENQISDLKKELGSYKEEQAKAVAAKKFEEADRLEGLICEAQSKLDKLLAEVAATEQLEAPVLEKRTDVDTILRYLTVAWALLKSKGVTELNPVLSTLKRDILTDVMMHSDDKIKARAFSCFAQCCLIDPPSARNGIHIFSIPIYAYQKGEECDIQVLIVSMKAVIDLLVYYGSSLMAEPDDDNENKRDSVAEEHIKIFAGGTSLTEFIQGLVDLMQDEQPEIQETAAQGLCELLINSRIRSAAVVSHLVLKWASPATESGLKQFIGLTLDSIYTVPGFTDNFEDSIALTIRTLVYAPKSSPLSDVNVDNITKFMLSLCRTSDQERTVHTKLALELCTLIQEKPNVKVAFNYAKVLLMLMVPTDELVVEQLLEICDNLKDNVRDRPTLNNITKFVARLTELKSRTRVQISGVVGDLSGIEELIDE